jgi:hypothetical protein
MSTGRSLLLALFESLDWGIKIAGKLSSLTKAWKGDMMVFGDV